MVVIVYNLYVSDNKLAQLTTKHHPPARPYRKSRVLKRTYDLQINPEDSGHFINIVKAINNQIIVSGTRICKTQFIKSVNHYPCWCSASPLFFPTVFYPFWRQQFQ